MLLIIGFILSLIELKKSLKNNKNKAIRFLLFIIIISLIYIYKEKIPSIMNIIIFIKERLYE